MTGENNFPMVMSILFLIEHHDAYGYYGSWRWRLRNEIKNSIIL